MSLWKFQSDTPPFLGLKRSFDELLTHFETLNNYQGVELAGFRLLRLSNKVLKAAIERPGTHWAVAIALPPAVERSPKPLSLRLCYCGLCFFSALFDP